MAVPIAGGASTFVAHGTKVQFSPDGATVAYSPESGHGNAVVLLDLSTKTETTVPLPSTVGGILMDLAWLPDSHHLLARTVRIDAGPAQDSTAVLLDTTTSSWTAVPALWTPAAGGNGYALQGPGPVSGSVLISMSSQFPESDPYRLLTIDVRTGKQLSNVRFPPGTSLIGRDASGTHLLMYWSSGPNTRLTTWDPSSPGSLRTLGPGPVAIATW